MSTQDIIVTLNDVAQAIGYTPDHNKEFSGDKLVQLVKQLKGEHQVMLERLKETEDVQERDGEIYWEASGDPIYTPEE